MMRMNKWQIIIPIILLVTLFISIWQIAKNPLLTTTQIETRIAEIYGGDVQNIILDDDEAIISFKSGDSMYEVEMNRENGSFERLIEIFKAPTSTSQTITTGKQTLLTPEQANTIATSKYYGTVSSNSFHEDIQSPYYEIVIESVTQQYNVNIDAQTGNIIAVSFEQLK